MKRLSMLAAVAALVGLSVTASVALADPLGLPYPADPTYFYSGINSQIFKCVTGACVPAANCVKALVKTHAGAEGWEDFNGIASEVAACLALGQTSVNGIKERLDLVLGMTRSEGAYWVMVTAAKNSGEAVRQSALKTALDASLAETPRVPPSTQVMDGSFAFPAGADRHEAGLLELAGDKLRPCLLAAGAARAGPNWYDLNAALAASQNCPHAENLKPASRALVVLLEAGKASGEPKRLRALRGAFEQIAGRAPQILG